MRRREYYLVCNTTNHDHAIKAHLLSFLHVALGGNDHSWVEGWGELYNELETASWGGRCRMVVFSASKVIEPVMWDVRDFQLILAYSSLDFGPTVVISRSALSAGLSGQRDPDLWS